MLPPSLGRTPRVGLVLALLLRWRPLPPPSLLDVLPPSAFRFCEFQRCL